MLTQEQRVAFEEEGFFRVAMAFSREAAALMEDRVWEALGEHYGIRRDQPETWAVAQATGLQPLKAGPVFEPIGGPATTAALDALLGAGGWQRPEQWGQFLVNFPTGTEAEWTVPGSLWHTDFDFLAENVLHGVVLFSYLADVPHRSGGTVVIAGSHRLVSRFVKAGPRETLKKMKVVRKAFLNSDPWLRALTTDGAGSDRIRRFMDTEHELDGIPVRVVELTGQSGDVVICHPWLVHSPAPNCGHGPRMMRIQRVQAAHY